MYVQYVSMLVLTVESGKLNSTFDQYLIVVSIYRLHNYIVCDYSVFVL